MLGGAYRPVDNDRWNTLIKYTNFYNLPSPGQITANGTSADYAQKSQVFSIDTIYDLFPWLSAGAPVGIRRLVVDGVKVSISYNFKRHSDDLTDLSYRSRE